MANMIDYINWRGDLDFKASPFNEVDSLIFTELSYMAFGELEEEVENKSIEAIAEIYLVCNGQEKIGALLTGPFSELLDSMAKSKRFSHLVVRNFVDIVDDEIEMQFSAMTFELDEHTAYIAFRGTDDTLVGWKEDFKMTFLDVVPAQIKAVAYLENMMKKYEYKEIYIGGHSKGGNLAVYAAVHASGLIKEKIVKVYNNDGPGFNQQLIESEQYLEVDSKIVSLIPQSSVVGMLLEHKGNYDVIKSTQKGLFQHDGFSWEVMGASFIHLLDVDDESRMIDMTLKNTLNAMTREQREEFTNVFFEVLSATSNRTLAEIQKDGIKSIISMRKSYNGLDKLTKKAVFDIMTVLFSEGMHSFREVKNVDQWQNNLQKWRLDMRKNVKDNKIMKNMQKARQKRI